jgi:isopenicillin-N N-acyltransferase like protein
VERIPYEPPYQYALPDRAAVTNHLLGPGADDPSNLRVMQNTSTLERKHRGDQLVARLAAPVTARSMMTMLRDRKGVNDVSLPLGDRRAIDAFIAAHGVVIDLTAKKLFVSHAPHLLGRFIEVDLDRLFDQAVPLLSLRTPSDVRDPDPLLAQGQHPAPSVAHTRSTSR